jgi:hypothetical protein
MPILWAVVTALDDYWDHCDKVHAEFSSTTAFLKGSRKQIATFANVVAEIKDILPCGKRIIHGYMSWLNKSDTAEIEVWIASDYRMEDHYTAWPYTFEWTDQKSWRLCVDQIAIIAHEIGHLLLKHQGLDIEVLPTDKKFPWMSPTEEWEAWLFSKFFCAYIISDYSLETRNAEGVDRAVDLFLHRRLPSDPSPAPTILIKPR